MFDQNQRSYVHIYIYIYTSTYFEWDLIINISDLKTRKYIIMGLYLHHTENCYIFALYDQSNHATVSLIVNPFLTREDKNTKLRFVVAKYQSRRQVLWPINKKKPKRFFISNGGRNVAKYFEYQDPVNKYCVKQVT